MIWILLILENKATKNTYFFQIKKKNKLVFMVEVVSHGWFLRGGYRHWKEKRMNSWKIISSVFLKHEESNEVLLKSNRNTFTFTYILTTFTHIQLHMCVCVCVACDVLAWLSNRLLVLFNTEMVTVYPGCEENKLRGPRDWEKTVMTINQRRRRCVGERKKVFLPDITGVQRLN